MLSQLESKNSGAWLHMAQQLGIPGPQTSQGRFADAFVIFSVTVLSMALGAWFLLQLGLSLWPGMAAALSIYTVLLLFHLLVRRAWIDTSSGEARDEMHWVAGEPELGAPGTEARDGPSFAPFSSAGPPAEGAVSERNHPHSLPDASAEVAFHYRPRDAGGTLGSSRGSSRLGANLSPPRGAGEAWQGAAPSPSEKNVELIQDLIKKLADELSDVPSTAPATTAVPGEGEDGMIARSLAALDTAAASMRAAAGEPDRETPGAWWQGTEPGVGAEASALRAPRAAAPPPQAPAGPPLPNAQVSRAAEAIAANRMEILLEPIQALNEGRARHFEISSRFLAADAGPIETAPLERTGLPARMDAARVIRAARVAQRLGERGREGNVMTRIDAESLTDPGFIDAVVQQAKTARGMGLILSLTQSAARSLTDIQLSGLQALMTAGCRFGLEDVSDLKMDFAALKTTGFAFVKLEAPSFLEGLSGAAGRVAASDVCRFLQDFGSTMIVARLEDG